MATEGYVKFEYYSKGVPPYYSTSGFPDLLDDEKITIETPIIEMSYHQYVGLFKKFLMAVGFDQKNIIQAGCSLAFHEMNDQKLMREVAEEYELIMSEDLPDILADSKKQDYEWIEKHNESWEQRYWALHKRFSKLAHLTDDDLEETATKYKERNDDMKPWNGLVPGSDKAREHGCKCPIMDNEEMPSNRKWVSGDCPIHGLKDEQ